jgi:hypothetical protein
MNNLKGQRFGRLKVISRSTNASRRVTWLCQCDCGKNKIINASNLTTGRSASCGCLRVEISKKKLKAVKRTKFDKGESSLNVVFYRYKYQAKRRGIEFNLTRDQFKVLTKEVCHYCGVLPEKSFKGHRSNGEYVYNGIDRINSDKDYTLDNVVPCCETCNKAKLHLSYDIFLNWVRRIARYQAI